MSPPRLPRPFALLVLVAALALIDVRHAQAGCGCDHPPPAWTQVMPPFASPGRLLALLPDGDELFVVGRTYEVAVGTRKLQVVASDPDRLAFEMPSGVKPGPTEIHVKGKDYDHRYPASRFTALPRAVKLPPYPGAFSARKLKSAIADDGTILLPLDLTNVLDPMQFAFLIANVSLDFGHDDVALLNADGVDLRAFTLAVADATRRQWGSYYGWEVQQDGALRGVVYETKVKKSRKKLTESDVLTYWRHEFHSYAAAHRAHGSHQVDARGYHPDGTFHVDHDHLVIAISGVVPPSGLEDDLVALDEHFDADRAKADAERADDLAKAGNDAEKRSKAEAEHAMEVRKLEDRYARDRAKLVARAKRLQGGDKDLDLRLVTIASDHPLEPEDITIDSAMGLEELAVE